MRTRPPGVEILLPLAAGLMLLGIAHAAAPLLAGILVVVTFLALGAIVPDHPWRTGAIGAVPGIVAAIGRAADDSLAGVGLAVPGMGFYGLLAKGGSVLARPRVERRSGGDGRWRPFETKAQRGRFLVLVAVLVLIGSLFLANWGADEVDRIAARRAGEIRSALAGHTPESLQLQGVGYASEGEGQLPGGPYDFASLGTDRFETTAEVRHRLQERCIHVLVTATGDVTTRIREGTCG